MSSESSPAILIGSELRIVFRGVIGPMPTAKVIATVCAPPRRSGKLNNTSKVRGAGVFASPNKKESSRGYQDFDRLRIGSRRGTSPSHLRVEPRHRFRVVRL